MHKLINNSYSLPLCSPLVSLSICDIVWARTQLAITAAFIGVGMFQKGGSLKLGIATKISITLMCEVC